MDIVIFIILIIIFALELLRSMLSSKREKIWSPVNFICLYFSYYVLVPYITCDEDLSNEAEVYILLGTLLFYMCFKIAFKAFNPRKQFFKLNNLITAKNARSVAYCVFGISFLAYTAFHGFQFSLISTEGREAMAFNEEGSYGHTEMYLTSLVSTFCFSCAILYAKKNKISIPLIALLLLSLIIYIIGGFRYRILILFMVMVVTIYLYPQPQKINYKVVVPIFIAMYLLMGIMETFRMYGKGLDPRVVTEIASPDAIKEAKENILVYSFSAKVMERYTFDNFIYFEPIATALCMPIPRAIFPGKPKGLYTREANMKVYYSISSGSAFLNITEAYISFGWIGIIFYGVFLGWLSKLFWNNYVRNKQSLGAILLLALYCGTLYTIVSRGYMAQALTTFVYYVFVPFWLTLLLKTFHLIQK